MKFQRLKRHIQEKDFSPCYIATGDDYFLIKKTEEMFSQLIKVNELNISFISDSAQNDEINSTLQTLPFMSEYRLVIADVKHLPAIKAYLKNPLENIIILLKGNVKKPCDPCQLIDCNRLDTKTLTMSIAAECQKNGASITEGAAVLLSEYCCRFMGRIKNELHKLIAACEDMIDKEDVRRLVVPELEYKVFELTDAISKKDKTLALTLLDDMLGLGTGGAYKIYGLLYSFFKRLLFSSLSPKDPNLKDYLSVKEFAVTSAVRQSKSFTQMQLKSLFDKLHRLDFDIKKGRINDKVGLQTFVMSALDEVV